MFLFVLNMSQNSNAAMCANVLFETKINKENVSRCRRIICVEVHKTLIEHRESCVFPKPKHYVCNTLRSEEVQFGLHEYRFEGDFRESNRM